MNLTIPEKFQYLEINEQWEEALTTIYDGRKSTIIIGNAGSGKSQLIHLMQEFDKAEGLVTLHVAPTGIAAVNIGGATIHSTFKLGISPKDPTKVYLTQDTREILELVDKIVIDEISMVRADLFDTMDILCRKAKKRDDFFGGIQVVCIGDLFQIPPIIGKDKDEILFFTDNYGDNPFFFASNCYKENHIYFERIEFTKIYRQKDDGFKDILNRIRIGEQTDDDLDIINSKRISYRKFKRDFKDGVYIAPYNNIVNTINEDSLSEINEKEFYFQAIIKGNINPRSFLAPVHLKLKKGAKIMMLVNDKTGRYQNGTLGYFDSVINKDMLQVIIDGHMIQIERYDFKEYAYKVSGRKLLQSTKGVFRQFGITLGFAFTGHKSQGCTFAEGYIDFAYKIFAEHLCYVMLSRFSSFDRIGLKRDLEHKDIMINDHVIEFMSTFNEETQDLPSTWNTYIEEDADLPF